MHSHGFQRITADCFNFLLPFTTQSNVNSIHTSREWRKKVPTLNEPHSILLLKRLTLTSQWDELHHVTAVCNPVSVKHQRTWTRDWMNTRNRHRLSVHIKPEPITASTVKRSTVTNHESVHDWRNIIIWPSLKSDRGCHRRPCDELDWTLAKTDSRGEKHRSIYRHEQHQNMAETRSRDAADYVSESEKFLELHLHWLKLQ